MELLQIIICLVRIPVISTTSMAGKSLLRCQVKENVIHFYKKSQGEKMEQNPYFVGRIAADDPLDIRIAAKKAAKMI